jgi:hypothetical protein
MGDGRSGGLRVDFDRRERVKFLCSQVTTDAGLLAYRELDEVLGLTEMVEGSLCDSRVGSNKQHQLTPLLRQSIYSRLAGYEDVNDAERLRVDPAMRHVVGGRASQPAKRAASMSEVGRFETEILSTKTNIKKLMDLSGEWIDRVHQRKLLKKLILDMDSSVSETYDQQEGTAYNGHFGCTCYHRLFLFNQDGDLERAMLRRGNHANHSDGDNGRSADDRVLGSYQAALCLSLVLAAVDARPEVPARRPVCGSLQPQPHPSSYARRKQRGAAGGDIFVSGDSVNSPPDLVGGFPAYLQRFDGPACQPAERLSRRSRR